MADSLILGKMPAPKPPKQVYDRLLSKQQWDRMITRLDQATYEQVTNMETVVFVSEL